MGKPTRSDEEDEKRAIQNLDQMILFDDSNVYPDGHVPEIGFQFVRQSIIPRTGDGVENITATDGVCGQLITFMFSVEASDQIKCYVIWNGQTMRFHGRHLWQVLPAIFEENEKNNEFRQNGEMAKEMGERFDKGV